MGHATIGSAAWIEALKREVFRYEFDVPARHKTKAENRRAKEYAAARGWSRPMANHAGRWFTAKGEDEGMCRVTNDVPGHRCKDMEA